MLSQIELNKLLEYRDGMLFRKINPRSIIIGTRAGSVSSCGYRYVRINGKQYPEHRIIWVMFNGGIDGGIKIDHKDNNPLNNRLENLRLATHNENMYNSIKSKSNKSGYKGVYYNKREMNWVAKIRKDGKRVWGKAYKTPELAYDGYKQAAIKYHGEFANFG